MKVLFQHLFFISLSFSLSALTPNPQDFYTSQAQSWSRDVISHVDVKDLPIMLRLLYSSYMRSYMTLSIQRDYSDLFERIGSGWNHIISTRLDPSKDAFFDAHALNSDLFLKDAALFHAACEAQKTYVADVEYIVTDYDKQFISLKVFVNDLRTRARSVVANSLIATISHIEQELTTAYEALLQAASLFKSEGHMKSSSLLSRPLTELMWYYIPSTLIQSFVHFDRAFIAGSTGCFAAYLTSQRVSNMIWHAIELPRASYYAAHYQELFILMQQHYPELLEGFEKPESITQQLIIYNALS